MLINGPEDEVSGPMKSQGIAQRQRSENQSQLTLQNLQKKINLTKVNCIIKEVASTGNNLFYFRTYMKGAILIHG
jgi:hypothetical protein